MPLVDRFMQVYGTLNPVEEAPYPSLEDEEADVGEKNPYSNMEMLMVSDPSIDLDGGFWE
jgi:hypothetical protein